MKPWQIGLVVVAVIALGVSVTMMLLGGSGPELADRVLLVDVSTGELFEIRTTGRTGILLPERHPTNDTLSLMPVRQGEDGEWYLSERYLGDMEFLEVEPDAVSGSGDSRVVEVTNEQPVVIRR